MNKILTGIIAGGVILTTATGVLAFTGNNSGGNGNSELAPGQRIQVRQEIREALDAQDYETWSGLVAETPRGEEMLDIINENNFFSLVEAHSLMESGDHEGAQEILQELGLNGFFAQNGQRMENREELMAAIENGDYETWRTLVEAHPNAKQMLEVVNEDNFYLFTEMHDLIQDGDLEGAKAIADDLGLERPMMGKNQKKGPKNGECPVDGERPFNQNETEPVTT